MAIVRSDTGIVEVGVENVAFGTQSLNMTRWHQLKALPDRSGLKQVYHPADRVRSGNYQEPGVLGHKSDSTIPLEMFLRGYKDTLPTNHPTIAAIPFSGGGDENPAIVALAHAIGMAHVSGVGAALSDIVDLTTDGAPADPTTTAFYVPTTEGDNYAEGQTIAVNIPVFGYEARRILTILSGGLGIEDLITVEFPFSDAPVRTLTVYAGIDIFPTGQPQYDSLSVNVQGEDNDGGRDWRHEILGVVSNALGLKFDAQGFVEASMDCDVADWDRADAGAAPLYDADAGPERQTVIGADFTMYVAGVPVCMDCAAMEFDCGLQMLRPKSACASQGVLRSRFGIHEPVLTIDPYKELEADWMSALAPFRSGTGVHFVFKAGTMPGRLIVLSVSNGHVTDEPVLGDRDGMLVNPLQVTPMVYTGDGTPGTDERNDLTPLGAPWTLAII